MVLLLSIWLLLVVIFPTASIGSPLFGHEPLNRDNERPSVPASHAIHERREIEHVEGWAWKERAGSGARVPVRIALQQSNLQQAHDKLMDISMPRSLNYGKHLTAQEVTDLFAPSSETVKVVWDWLVRSGIRSDRLSHSANKQWIQFHAKVEEVERLLFTTYHVYEHEELGVRNIACSKYHVPSTVKQHIDYITPGIQLMSIGLQEAVTRKRRKEQSRKRQVEPDLAYMKPGSFVQGGCDRTVTPHCIKNQYQIPNITTARPGNELGIFQSLNQHYLQEDLDSYFAVVANYIPPGSHPELRSINGAYGPANKSNMNAVGEEADMDFEIAMPLIHPQTTVLWQTDDDWYDKEILKGSKIYTGFFNTFFDAIDNSYCSFAAYNEQGNCETPECMDPVYPNPNPGGYQGQLMCGEYKPTNVIAISYSGVERVLPYSYMQRQCIEVLKLGLQGITVVESSGDTGVGGTRTDVFEGCLGANRTVFTPRTMSNCPYILSVGATKLVNDTTTPGKYVEETTTFFSSGGGFSNVFDTPSWQEDAVQNYLQIADLPFGGYEGGGRNYSTVGADPSLRFNKAGRGYPDVSAVGDNLVIMHRGRTEKVGGTSISVPVWAAILTLINEERLAVNMTPVGFVNPVLYEHPEAFVDIVDGRNPGCGTTGFQARKGWDPVTGLGTPIYPKLRDIFLGLPLPRDEAHLPVEEVDESEDQR